MTLPTEQAKETPVAHEAAYLEACIRPGDHFVIELKAHDNWLCRSRIRGLGQCNTEVLLPDDGVPPLCPRCRQPLPWLGTMEIT